MSDPVQPDPQDVQGSPSPSEPALRRPTLSATPPDPPSLESPRAAESTAAGPASTGQGATLYDSARSLAAENLTIPQIQAELLRRGHDPDSVRVVLNSLPGARLSVATVQFNIDQSVNALSPQLLSFSGMGLDGDRATVALYWMAFGTVLAIIVTLILLVGQVPLLESTSGLWARFALPALPWVGYPLALLAIARGFLKVLPLLRRPSR